MAAVATITEAEDGHAKVEVTTEAEDGHAKVEANTAEEELEEPHLVPDGRKDNASRARISAHHTDGTNIITLMSASREDLDIGTRRRKTREEFDSQEINITINRKLAVCIVLIEIIE